MRYFNPQTYPTRSLAWQEERRQLAEQGLRRCSTCREVKAETEYYRSPSGYRGRFNTCRTCFIARQTKWSQENQEKIRAYREANRELDRERQRAYYAENRDRLLERRREWRKQNPERVREAQRKSHVKRVKSGKVAEQSRIHRERMRVRTEEQILADRARLRPRGVKLCRGCRQELPLDRFGQNRISIDGLEAECRPCHTARVNGRLLRRAAPAMEAFDIWACVYCQRPYDDIDHVIPRAAGGTNDAWNLRPSCSECNRGLGGKFDRPVLDFVLSKYPELESWVSRAPWRWVDPSEDLAEAA